MGKVTGSEDPYLVRVAKKPVTEARMLNSEIAFIRTRSSVGILGLIYIMLRLRFA